MMFTILRMITPVTRLALLSATFCTLVGVAAQETAHGAGHTGMNSKMHTDMKKMMDDMHAVKSSGNMDVDFAKMMIPHHQGAIDMAQMELNHGTDPMLKKMATEIIAAQKKEIKVLQDWLTKNDKSGRAR